MTAYTNQKIEPIVCFSLDDFIEDQDKPIYIAELSDGRKVYQDDKRPDMFPIAWLRLKEFCYNEKIDIVKMFVRFRSHTELSGESEDGFFFRRKALGSFGEEKTNHYFIIGSINKNNIHCKHWRVPEIILDEEDDRDILSEESIKFRYEEQIIWSQKRLELM